MPIKEYENIRSVLISIHPIFAEKILSGNKQWELRKTEPKGISLPFRVLMHETKPGTGSIVGEFICDAIFQEDGKEIACWHEQLSRKGGISPRANSQEIIRYHMLSRLAKESFLSPGKMAQYAGHGHLYAWHVQAAIRFEEPRPLSEYGLTRPPQSWQYIRAVDPSRPRVEIEVE